jgi:hypothetical protein
MVAPIGGGKKRCNVYFDRHIIERVQKALDMVGMDLGAYCRMSTAMLDAALQEVDFDNEEEVKEVVYRHLKSQSPMR